MKEIEALTAIPYPTPYMQGLFPSLGGNLHATGEFGEYAINR